MMRIFAFLVTFLSFQSFAAPKSELWDFWNSSNQANEAMISHQPWQLFLDKYLVQEGEYTLIAYKDVSDADLHTLNAYIDDLASLDPRTYAKSEQYAYWVNLYNAITVSLILEEYPIKSITKLGGLFSFGPWGDNVVTIEGKTLTLNDIEHRILRPIWNDPRTHYAVNCASLGCPNLQALAFTADNSETLLEKSALEFVNSDKGVLISGSSIQLSSIYDWFITDFGTQKQLLEHINTYRLEKLSSLEGSDYEYDWSLNEKR